MARVAGIILAGGGATRIGGEKALTPFLSGVLLDAVISRAAPQVDRLALNVPSARERDYRERYGVKHALLIDEYPIGTGPLAGIIAGLGWLAGLDGISWLATFPCDTPFFPRDLVAQLMAAANDAPVFAHDGERLQGVCAVWPLSCLRRLEAGVEGGKLRSLHSAMEALGGSTCRVEAGANAFFNINTPEDLLRAKELAQQR